MIIFTLSVGIGIAVTTFVANDMGAGKIERAKKIVKLSMYLNVCCISVIFISTYIF